MKQCFLLHSTNGRERHGVIVTKQNAQQIAERIGAILHRNVNIMDAGGMIVASTDLSRVDTVHQAAKELIEHSAPEMDVYSGDHLSGSREGINLPLRIGGRTVGVIGITGNPDELRDIGLVILEMAEILFTETFQDQKRNENHRNRRHLLETLLYGEPSALTDELLRYGRALGIDAARMKAVAVLSAPAQRPCNGAPSPYDILMDCLRSRLGTTFSHYLHVGEKLILFFNTDAEHYLLELLNGALQDARTRCGGVLFCGISGSCQAPSDLKEVYGRAEMAFQLACANRRGEVCRYEDFVLELLLAQLDREQKAVFLKRIWNGVSPAAMEEMLDFLEVYFDCDGAIGQIAARLFLHKNTVQYKLRKIEALTGYDPRHAGGAAILYLTVKLRRNP